MVELFYTQICLDPDTSVWIKTTIIVIGRYLEAFKKSALNLTAQVRRHKFIIRIGLSDQTVVKSVQIKVRS